jgi:hypothetical protein
MLKNLSRGRVLAAWCAAAAVTIAAGLVADPAAAPSPWILLTAVCLAPPVMRQLFWRDVPQRAPLVRLDLMSGKSRRARFIETGAA